MPLYSWKVTPGYCSRVRFMASTSGAMSLVSPAAMRTGPETVLAGYNRQRITTSRKEPMSVDGVENAAYRPVTS